MWKVPWEALFPRGEREPRPCLEVRRWALWGEREAGKGERAMVRGSTYIKLRPWKPRQKDEARHLKRVTPEMAAQIHVQEDNHYPCTLPSPPAEPISVPRVLVNVYMCVCVYFE